MGTTEKDPIENLRWRSIRKECTLARGLIGSGITELGKANYRDDEWHYYNAFFGLSIGIERLAKLIIIANDIIENDGTERRKDITRPYGHDLMKLLTKVAEIAKTRKRELQLTYPFPCNDISTVIICCLNSFAASNGRYFNFNPNADMRLEPIRRWWNQVGGLIFNKHYNKVFEEDIINYANRVSKNTDTFKFLPYMAETGEVMHTMEDCLVHDGQTNFVQEYGRFYTLIIVRWMAEVFINLCDSLSNEPKFEILYGHSKYFVGFIQSDEHLKITKHWPVEIYH